MQMASPRSLFVAICISTLAVDSANAEDDARPLLRAHAHNDYLHNRPLLDALQHGFCSVEADIFLVNGELLVAHTRFEVSPEKTLERLYLKPLRQRIKQNNGRVYRSGPGFTLLIDIKNNGTETYRALHQMLTRYQDVFSHADGNQVHQKAVTAIISGDRPVEVVTAESTRLVGIDGRLTDLNSDLPAHLMPLISDNWRNHFRWNGQGEFPVQEEARLLDIVKQVHSRNRRIRFWATPDNPAVWNALNEAGVDLINTDNLPGLRQFLQTADPQVQ